ncbi:hypothetical protein [Acetobacter senegalensis]|uniref:hypothetical protein n=1 Tax=Acetobacter senegalensis TaxID=446692 RepID=UPI002656F2FF|nr:hypothetical protein [Acetobacter senegalensis]MDN7351786.1 hypothetical protein [Acetobacter senegalensis]
MSTVHQKTDVVALEEVMGRIVEQVVAAHPQINGKRGGEISALVKKGALDADEAIRHVTNGQDLLDAYSKAEAVAVLAVWQLLSMGAYINAQENELQAASAATKH